MGVLLTVARFVSPLPPFTWLSRLFSVLLNWSLRVMEGLQGSVWSKTDSFSWNSTEEDYDSTWDDDEEQEDPTEVGLQPPYSLYHLRAFLRINTNSEILKPVRSHPNLPKAKSKLNVLLSELVSLANCFVCLFCFKKKSTNQRINR